MTLTEKSVVSLLPSSVFLGNIGRVTFSISMPQNVMIDTAMELEPACTGTLKFEMKVPVTGRVVPGQAVERFGVVSRSERMIVKANYLQGINGTQVGLQTWIRVSPPPPATPEEPTP